MTTDAAGLPDDAVTDGALGPVRYRLAVPAASLEEYRVMQDALRARLIGSRPRRLGRALVAGLVAGAVYAAGVALAFHAGAGARLELWSDRYGLSWGTDGFGILLLCLGLYLLPVLLIAALQRRARRRLHRRLYALTEDALAGHELLLGEAGLGRDWQGRRLVLPWTALSAPRRVPGMVLLWHGLDTIWLPDRAVPDPAERDAVLAFLAARAGGGSGGSAGP